MLEESDADVLLLLDCCYSAALPTTGSHRRSGGTVEVIAACGHDAIAAEVDEHSFTRALISELAMSSESLPFSIGVLHSRVFSRLKCLVDELATDEEGKYVKNGDGRLIYKRQPRKTPIHSIICETIPRRSIILGPLPTLSSSSSPASDLSTPGSSATSLPPLDTSNGNARKKRKRSVEDSEGKHPQVLVAVRLDDAKVEFRAWIDWIRSAPPEARDIRIEGVYDSLSTLVLLRMPVALWNLLPENPAYSFVAFVTSRNNAADWNQDAAIVCPCEDGKCDTCKTAEQKLPDASEELADQASRFPTSQSEHPAEETVKLSAPVPVGRLLSRSLTSCTECRRRKQRVISSYLSPSYPISEATFINLRKGGFD
jgi:hypothetical protein